MLNTHLEGMAQDGSSLSKGLLLKSGNDIHIEGSGMTTAPVKKYEFSWPGKLVLYEIGVSFDGAKAAD